MIHQEKVGPVFSGMQSEREGKLMAQTNWYAMPVQEVLKRLDISGEGLSRAEAARRLEKCGPNTLKEEKKISPWQILLGNSRIS